MFYEHINRVCSEKGMKLTPLLKEIGVSTGITGRWKKGGVPGIDIVNKLADKLGVSVDYLLEKTDDPTPADKKIAPLESLDSGEVIRQVLVREGIIKPDQPMTEDAKKAFLAYAETWFKREDSK